MFNFGKKQEPAKPAVAAKKSPFSFGAKPANNSGVSGKIATASKGTVAKPGGFKFGGGNKAVVKSKTPPIEKKGGFSLGNIFGAKPASPPVKGKK